MKSVGKVAVKGASAFSTYALRSAIQRVASTPSVEGIRSLFVHPQLIPAQAADLWSIAQKNHFIYDTSLCLAYMGYQATRGEADLIQRAMDLMSITGFVHDERTYVHLIRAYVNMKSTVGLLKTYFQLSQANVPVTDRNIQTSVLAYFARNPTQIEQVELFLAITTMNPRSQYNVLYSAVISELIKGDTDLKTVDKVKHYMREMDTLGITPLTTTFEVLIHSDKLDFETALQLFNKMRKLNCATVYAYSSMIQRNGEQGRLKECQRLWLEMLELGLTPTPVAYCTMMQPLANRGRGRECAKFLQDMLTRGVRPSLLSFSIQAHAYISEGSLDKAVSVLDDMAQHKVKPDSKLYHMLVRAHVDAEDMANGVALVERAYDNNVPAGDLIAILLSTYGDADVPGTHDLLLKDLDDKKVSIGDSLRDAILARRSLVPFPPGHPPFSYRRPHPNSTPDQTLPHSSYSSSSHDYHHEPQAYLNTPPQTPHEFQHSPHGPQFSHVPSHQIHPQHNNFSPQIHHQYPQHTQVDPAQTYAQDPASSQPPPLNILSDFEPMPQATSTPSQNFSPSSRNRTYKTPPVPVANYSHPPHLETKPRLKPYRPDTAPPPNPYVIPQPKHESPIPPSNNFQPTANNPPSINQPPQQPQTSPDEADELEDSSDTESNTTVMQRLGRRVQRQERRISTLRAEIDNHANSNAISTSDPSLSSDIPSDTQSASPSTQQGQKIPKRSFKQKLLDDLEGLPKSYVTIEDVVPTESISSPQAKPQTRNAIAQRLQRRNDRMEKKIKTLQSQNELNALLLAQLTHQREAQLKELGDHDTPTSDSKSENFTSSNSNSSSLLQLSGEQIAKIEQLKKALQNAQEQESSSLPKSDQG